MTRLYVLVEGQTEEAFAKSVLEPHLRSLDVWVYPIIVETSRDAFGRKRRGGGSWAKWRRDLLRLTGEHPGPDVRFTTMFDLYGLPRDFPELAASDPNTVQRAARLEHVMLDAIGDRRLVPYIQRHEFETLVLAALDALAILLDNPDDRSGIAALKALLSHQAPEDINEGHDTAPSKRLEASIRGYRKTLHGPLALAETGLAALRTRCPRFDAWVTRLEQLAGTPR